MTVNPAPTTAATPRANVLANGVLVYRRRARPAAPCPPPVSREAQRLAAAILEVLAGVATPSQAAAALGMALPRYYLGEQRALEGLVRACEPRPLGKAASQQHRIAALEKEIARLKQDCARQQALVRASQRAIGIASVLPPPAKATAKEAGKAGKPSGKFPRRRRTAPRALKAAAALRTALADDQPAADSSSRNGVNLVQPTAFGSPSQPAAPVPAVAAMLTP